MRSLLLLTAGAVALFATGATAQTTTAPSQPPVAVPQSGAPVSPGTIRSDVPEEEEVQARSGANATAGAPGTPATNVTASATPAVVNPAVGVTVYDPAGTSVGTIKAIDATYVTLTTPKGEVKLPAAGVGPGRNGAAVGLTAAQIDAAVAQAAAAQPAAAATGTSEAAATAPAPRRARRNR